MSAQPQIKLTEAENALLLAYTEQVGDLPGNGDVLIARDRLITDLKTRACRRAVSRPGIIRICATFCARSRPIRMATWWLLSR